MNSSLTGKGDLKRISAILEQMKEQQDKRIAETIELAKSSPVPWPTELIHRISFTMNDDFDEVMTHHPGHKIFNTHESIKFFLDLFDDTYKELEKAIKHYHVSYKEPEFFSRRGRDKHDRAIFDLNRCIFNFTSAGDALRNICMRQEKHYTPQSYEEHKRNYFGQNKLHHFMQKLRVALHHEHFVKAGPSITYTGSDSHKTNLYLECRQLLRLEAIQEKAEALKYVEESGVRIDVQEVFRHYLLIVKDFYDWLLNQMDMSSEFADYRRCVLERKKTLKRQSFKLFIDQWIKSGINPYEHLDKYLSDDEITYVKHLPHGSQQQVDKIIAFADEEGACNDVLRKKIYELFKISDADSLNLLIS